MPMFSVNTVNAIWLSPEGWVSVVLNSPLGNKNWWLCRQRADTSVNAGYGAKTVNAATCAGVQAQLLTAQAQGRPVYFKFHGLADCNSASLPPDGGSIPMNPYYANLGIF